MEVREYPETQEYVAEDVIPSVVTVTEPLAGSLNEGQETRKVNNGHRH